MRDPGSAGDTGRPLRVAFLVYRGNPRCGGQGVYTRHLSRELARLGHEVTVFAGQPYPELDDGVELVKVPSLDLYRDVDAFRRPRRRELTSPTDLVELATMWSGGFGEPRTFSRRVAEVLAARSGDFDLVHDDQSLGSGLLNLLGAGWPVIASIHHPITIDRSLDLSHAESPRRQASLRRWYRFATMQARVARRLPALLTVSESSKRDIVSEMGVDAQRVHIVPVGVDLSVFRPLPTVARVPGRILTTASADVPLKGLVPLLEALAKLRVEREDGHLVVIGNPREHSPARAVIERLGLAPFIEFKNGISDEELVAEYAACSVAVVPSLYEGFSLPAAEAMACGVPVVATTGGALPEVLGPDGEAARLVAPDDPGALCTALGEVLGDAPQSRALGAGGLRRVTARFTWQRCALGTAAAYRALLEEAGRC